MATAVTTRASAKPTATKAPGPPRSSSKGRTKPAAAKPSAVLLSESAAQLFCSEATVGLAADDKDTLVIAGPEVAEVEPLPPAKPPTKRKVLLRKAPAETPHDGNVSAEPTTATAAAAAAADAQKPGSADSATGLRQSGKLKRIQEEEPELGGLLCCTSELQAPPRPREVVAHGRQPAQMLTTVVALVLSLLPTRYTPTRCFLTAALEIVLAFLDTWMESIMTASSLAADEPGDGVPHMCALLSEDLGPACAEAWWLDAEEASRRPSSAPSYSSSSPSSSSSRQGASRSGRGPSDLVSLMRWTGGSNCLPELGACFIAAALGDIVGTAVVHASRKTAAALSSRPTTSGGSRPLTAGLMRPSTAGGEAVPSKKAVAAAISAESKQRLISLKHLVGAVRGDPSLRLSPTLASSLARAARPEGQVAQAQLLSIPLYRERLSLWTSQEESAGGPEGASKALAQAMKLSASLAEDKASQLSSAAGLGKSLSSSSSTRPGGGGGGAASSSQARPSSAGAPNALSSSLSGSRMLGQSVAARGSSSGGSTVAPSSKSVRFGGSEAPFNPTSRVGQCVPKPPSRGQGWLPKKFVRDFNAEGEEVEAPLSESEEER